MNGIINIYKERGYTSFDAVARLRGITGQRHIGHTGTLDPDAEGVLPICLGNATKACDILTDRSKVYETVLLLGVETDSQDISGDVVRAEGCVLADGAGEDNKAAAVSCEKLSETLKCFLSDYRQTPPMYSAVLVDGKRLYEMARKGVEIEREAREVSIESIEVISDVVAGTVGDVGDMDSLQLKDDACLGRYGIGEDFLPEEGRWQHFTAEQMGNRSSYLDVPVVRVALRIECSKGTYIRTLCHDIGRKLGCGGCMEKLLRTRVGGFTIEDSLRLKTSEDLMHAGELESHLKAADECFPEYKCLHTKAKYDDMLINGNVLYFRHFSEYITEAPTPVRAYTSNGDFLGVYVYEAERNRYKPLRMFR